MKLTRNQLSLLGLLAKGGGKIHVYNVFKKLKLPLPEIIKISSQLKEKNLIERNDLELKLSSSGKDWLIQNRRDLIWGEDKPWKQVPEEFKVPALEPNQPYAPKIKMLDPTIRKSIPIITNYRSKMLKKRKG